MCRNLPESLQYKRNLVPRDHGLLLAFEPLANAMIKYECAGIDKKTIYCFFRTFYC